MTNISINPDIFTSSLGKTILITGSARGIGAATAKKFSDHGANTVLVDLPVFQPIAEQLIRDELTTDRAVFFGADITYWNDLQGCFKNAIDRFGAIDVVIINAGVMESKSVFDFEVDEESGDLIEEKEGERVFDVNLKGTLNTLRLAMFYLSTSPTHTPTTASPSKSIVLIGSSSSYFGGTGVAAYVASKHGVLGLLRASQTKGQELGIRINMIAPFLTPTQITAGFTEKWRERGLEENSTERVAEAIAFVALDERMSGEGLLVAGRFLRELEFTRTKLIPIWLGEDVAQFMATAMQFFVSIGGYVLPKKY